MRIAVLSVLALLSHLCFQAAAVAQTASVTVAGTVLSIDGEIAIDTSAVFAQNLLSNPQVQSVRLNSPGGRVIASLEIARIVKSRGISTHVKLGDGCYSACANIFLAGQQRIADGLLGVHQISGVNDPSVTQSLVAEMYEDLVAYNTPSYLISRMLRTPPYDMYIFTAEELERNSINIRAEAQISVPHLQPIETWLREEWLFGIFLNTHINQTFVAIESRQADPLLRIVHYPHRNQNFLEIMFEDVELTGIQTQLEFQFSHSGDADYVIPVVVDIETNSYAFDLPSDLDQIPAFWAAFSGGTDLKVLNSLGVEVAHFKLAGSGRATSDFRAAIVR